MNERDGRLKKQVFSGLIWKFGERAGVQFVNFSITIILARMLSPESFGLISIVTVFITLADVFVNGGFGNALVQRKDADNVDFSSVFYFSVVMSVIIYAIVFACAPAIAWFYENETLTTIIRAMSIRILFGGINIAQNAHVQRNMLFRKYFFSTLTGTALSSVAAIIMAFNGFGVWALVFQYVINSAVNTIILWFTVRWRPQLIFSWQRMRGMFSYGWRLLVGSLINTLYEELRSLVIGKLYSSADLAYYTRGKSFPHLIIYNINASISAVLFPAITKKQDDLEKVRAMTRRSIRTSAYLIIPAMTGLAVVAEPLVRLLLTENWIECVPYLRISCYASALMPLQTANLEAIKAIGRSDVTLRLEIIKRTIGLGVLFLVMNHGVMAIALSTIFTSTVISMINAFPNKKLMNYRYLEQLKDIAPFAGMSVLMAVCIYPICWLSLPSIVILAMQVIFGAALYYAQSRIFKVESYTYIKNTIRDILKSRTAKSGNS